MHVHMAYNNRAIKENTVTESTPIYRVSFFRKKHFLSEGLIEEILAEAGAEDRKLTSVLTSSLDNWNDEKIVVAPPEIVIPDEEFVELFSGLPEFLDCPIMYVGWQNFSCPVEFIVTSMKDGDRFFVDTQGYDYCRYKGYLLEPLDMRG